MGYKPTRISPEVYSIKFDKYRDLVKERVQYKATYNGRTLLITRDPGFVWWYQIRNSDGKLEVKEDAFRSGYPDMRLYILRDLQKLINKEAQEASSECSLI